MSNHIDDSTTDLEIEAVVERDRIRREIRDGEIAATIDRDILRKENDQLLRESYQTSRYAVDLGERIARAREMLLGAVHVHQPTSEEVLRAIDMLEGRVTVAHEIQNLEIANVEMARRISKTREILIHKEVPLGKNFVEYALDALDGK